MGRWLPDGASAATSDLWPVKDPSPGNFLSVSKGKGNKSPAHAWRAPGSQGASH